MEPNKILKSDILDLLFENRNKDYGAYELRRKYNKRITAALLITAGILAIVLGMSLLANSLTPTSDKLDIKDVELVNVQDEPPPVEPPPPPPPKQEPPPKVEMTKFTPPLITKDEDVKEDEKPPEVEKLEETVISLKNQEGIKTTEAIPVIDEGTKVVEQPKDETNYDQTFTKVEVEAKFPGDWRKYLTRNLNASAPIDNGAPPGQYTVIVQFIVDKEGKVSDVKAMTNHGYGMEEEAVRVIKKATSWEPAIQNGRQVKAYKKQPITFIVSEQ
jgi:periplasmic protein TonB